MNENMDRQERICKETWNLIEASMFSVHGCLLPPGDFDVPVVLPWTREKFLGVLKRKGRIVSWVQDTSFSEGNLRKYLITLDSDKI